MSDNKTEIIMRDDPRCAVPVTATVYEDTTGRRHLDESAARICSKYTHQKCKNCERVLPRHKSLCDDCYGARKRQKWEELKTVPWDGGTPLCLYGGDTFFYDKAEIFDHCKDNGCCPSQLMLVLSEPDYGPVVDTDIFDEHCVPGDGPDVPDAIVKKINELNALIREHGPYVWWETKTAVRLTTEDDAEFAKKDNDDER